MYSDASLSNLNSQAMCLRSDCALSSLSAPANEHSAFGGGECVNVNGIETLMGHITIAVAEKYAYPDTEQLRR